MWNKMETLSRVSEVSCCYDDDYFGPPHNLWGPSSPTRDRTPLLRKPDLNHWTARKVPDMKCFTSRICFYLLITYQPESSF